MTDRKCANCSFWSANTIKPEIEDGYYACLNESIGGEKGGEDGADCAGFMGADSTEVNVPQHTPNGTMNFKNENPVGAVHILIVTYEKDFPWLDKALQCIAKHAKAFSGLTVAIPDRDQDALFAITGKFRDEQFDFPVRARAYHEPAGKGFLNHEAMMARADELVPIGTKYVMHMDADCMMKMSNTPEDYFLHDKPIYIWRTWESLASPDPHDPRKKIVSDCIMWKAPTEAQLGYLSDAYTMTRHPTIFPIEFYLRYRAFLEKVHDKSFMDYMLSGSRNSHPQDRMDFTAMGQFAFTYMRDKFHWINCATEEYPADRMRAYHSHSGFNPTVDAEIAAYLV